MSPSQPYQTHDLLWDRRLQDCLDDCLDSAGRAALDAHLGECSQCCQRSEELCRLDETLHAWIGRPGLSVSFDRKLLSLIDTPADV